MASATQAHVCCYALAELAEAPCALQWRQQQRGGQARPRLILLDAGDVAENGEASSQDGDHGHDPDGAGGARQLLAALGMRDVVNARLRTSGILERDREDAWDAVD